MLSYIDFVIRSNRPALKNSCHFRVSPRCGAPEMDGSFFVQSHLDHRGHEYYL